MLAYRCIILATLLAQCCAFMAPSLLPTHTTRSSTSLSMKLGGNKQADMLARLKAAQAKKGAPSSTPTKVAAAAPSQTQKPVEANTAWRSGASAAPAAAAEVSRKPGRGGVASPQDSIEDSYRAFEDLLEQTSELCFNEDAEGNFVELDDDGNKGKRGISKARPPVRFVRGDFAPLDVWSQLKDVEGGPVNYKSVAGSKLLVVVADNRPGTFDMRQTLISLNNKVRYTFDHVLCFTVQHGDSSEADDYCRGATRVLA
jgi:hypothetical protein